MSISILFLFFFNDYIGDIMGSFNDIESAREFFQKDKFASEMGITLDEEANHKRGEEIAITTPDSKTTVMVIPTNEELAIARETARLV